MITEELLREKLEDAKDAGRRAVLIYHNESLWFEHHEKMVQGNEKYDFFMSQLERDEDAVLIFGNQPCEVLLFIALVDKMLDDQNYFKDFLDTCVSYNVEGPIEEFIEQ